MWQFISCICLFYLSYSFCPPNESKMQFFAVFALSFFVVINAQFELNPEAPPKQCYMQNNEEGECVFYYLCHNETNKVIVDGNNVIDIRAFGECDYTEICCGLPDIAATTPNTRPTPPPPPVTQSPPPAVERCGVRNANGVSITVVGANSNEAQFAEFPWMVAILREERITATGKNLYVYQCGGSLIHPRVVMTAAHCVNKINANQKFKIRAGEYDTQILSEPLPHQDRDVTEFVMHENFIAGNAFNDIALLFLNTPMSLTRNVGVVCLPRQSRTVAPANCFATGWGKNQFGKAGAYQSILKKMELPVVQNPKCQTELRKTRLGRNFELHSSFMCAGGVAGKDACTGDGGSPLACPMAGRTDRYEQVGIVAWGIGCGTTTPGVYANVPFFRNWIDEQMILHSVLDMDRYGP